MVFICRRCRREADTWGGLYIIGVYAEPPTSSDRQETASAWEGAR